MTHIPTGKAARAFDAVPRVDPSVTTAPLSEGAGSTCSARALLHWVFPLPSTVVLRSRTLSIGRDTGADVQLHSDAVSRKHAQLVPISGGFELEDCKSRNGVFVNAVRQTRSRLQLGDVLRVADHVGLLLQTETDCSLQFGQLAPGVWGSGVLAQSLELARRVAPSGLPILILGESGTGKESIAQAIHGASLRAGRFVALNCAALSEHLLEAELFGHERGAFTGAHAARPGYVQWANTGTLFLDEISELSASAQAKLLRVIQEGEVRALGAREPEHVDLRVVAATHRDLAERVRSGQFRLDLYQRLAGVTLKLPALRQRPADIVPLFVHFAREQGVRVPQLCERFVEALCLYPWPGNVRELQRVARATAAIHGGEPRWRRSHLPEELQRSPTREADAAPRFERVPSARLRPSELCDETIKVALRAANGNLSSAARALSISRQSLYDLLKARGIGREVQR